MGSITAKTENRDFVKNIFGRSVMRNMDHNYRMNRMAENDNDKQLFDSVEDYVEQA